MRYNFEIEVEEKPVIKMISIKLPEPVYREFKYATHTQGTTMTQVVIDMMRQFADTYKTKGQPKQTSFI